MRSASDENLERIDANIAVCECYNGKVFNMPNNTLKKHFFISFVALIVLLGLVFLASFFTKDIVVFYSLILTSFLSSLVIYLLLASNTRVELKVIKETENLTATLDQFIRLYESAPVPYVMLNSKGEINRPNKAALRFFGMPPEALEGKVIFLLFAKEDLERGNKLFQFYTRNISISNEEIQMVTNGNKLRWVALSIFDMKNSVSGGRTGLASILDITEQKKLAEAKTEFVSLASHQLRTPLATMQWFMDILASGDIGELPAKQKDYIKRLYGVNLEMISLVDTLLNVSRIEIGSLPIDKSPTNVETLAESILTELSAQISMKKIRIEKQYNGFLQNINADPKLLRIVMQNLVSNAVKYTPEGGVVTLSFVESGSKREVVVSDTGFGIPKSDQGLIFTKLFRADNARKLSASQGTGLGLYLVKSIMEALGGSISFVSEENKGSVFTITLSV